MTAAEREAAVQTIAANPQAGELIIGTGGCRKLRLAGRGKGKSGGYRLITFYVDNRAPAFLLTAFSKGERSDLSQKERNALSELTKTLVKSLGARAVDKGRTT